MTMPTIHPLLTLLAFGLACYLAAADQTRLGRAWALACAILMGGGLALRLSMP